ncbi:hypothetical protein pb186bvf_001074 [Paramecium bursaria]
MQKFDLFGVPFMLRTPNNQRFFQSPIGGIISIICISLSMSYFFYVLIQWQQGGMLPKTSLQQIVLSYAEQNISNGQIQISIFNDTSGLDPFSKNQNIITPFLIKIKDTTFQEPVAFFSNQIQTSNGKLQFYLEPQNLQLVLNTINDQNDQNRNLQKMTQYAIVLSKCKQTLLPTGSSCADQQTIDDYFNDLSDLTLIQIVFNLQQYDPQKNKFSSVFKTQYLVLNQFLSLFTQIMVQVTQLSTNDGILLEKYSQRNYINNFVVVNQQIPADQAQLYGISYLAAFLLRLDNIQIQSIVVYPNLGEVLASIGSISSIVFLLRYVAIFLNQELLDQQIVSQLIKSYYPQFEKIEIIRDWKFQIKKALYKGKYLQYETFIIQYEQLLDIAIRKLSISNVLHEISRYQLTLQQHHGLKYFDNLSQHCVKFILSLQNEDQLDSINFEKEKLKSSDDSEKYIEHEPKTFGLLTLK